MEKRTTERADSVISSSDAADPDPIRTSQTHDDSRKSAMSATASSINAMYRAIARWFRPTLRGNYSRLEWHDSNRQSF